MSGRAAAEMQLIEDVAAFHDDPLGYALYVFPWGQKGTSLEGKALRRWQRAFLDRVGKQLRAGVVDAGEVIREATASGHGIGKAQPLYVTVMTPRGPVAMGNIKPGDTVCAVDGTTTTVLATATWHDRPVYRITLDDGAVTYADGAHVWRVQGRNQRRKGGDAWCDMTTEQLVAAGVKRLNGRALARHWALPACAPAHGAQPGTQPYALGVWLGDGHAGSGRYTKPDAEVAEHLRAAGETVTDASGDMHSVGGLAALLRRLGLFRCRSYERFIPPVCFGWSADARAELLAGLLDTDGTTNATGSIVFGTTSERLAADVRTLVQSLGGKAKLQPTVKRTWYRDDAGDKVPCRPLHRVTVAFPSGAAPFRLPRKLARLSAERQARYSTRWIDRIERVADDVTKCIQVAHPSGLYLTDEYIVTHNSALVAMLVKWAFDTREDTRGIVTANTETQLRTKTWPELTKWHNLSLTNGWATVTATAMISNAPGHDKTWRIDAVPWSEHNTEAFAGLHNEGIRLLLVFDEASGIADRVWEVAEGALTDENTEIIWAVFGNPTRNTGRFRETFRDARWHTQHIDSRTVEGVNLVEIAGTVAAYGEDHDVVKVRVRGLFPSQSASQFISEDEVKVSQAREAPPQAYQHAARVLGVDVARHGDDDSCIIKRQGMYVEKPRRLHITDTMRLAAEVADVIESWKPDAVFIDATGIGWGVFDRLRQLGYGRILYGVQTGEKAFAENEYRDHRSELWWRMRQWIQESGVLPNDDTLARELQVPEYDFIKNRMQLETKKQIKARGESSPDSADALALTFHQTVAPRKRDDTAEWRKKLAAKYGVGGRNPMTA